MLGIESKSTENMAERWMREMGIEIKMRKHCRRHQAERHWPQKESKNNKRERE